MNTSEAIPANTLLTPRLLDVQAARAILFREATVLSEGALATIFLELLRRSNTGSGAQIKLMETTRVNACLPEISTRTWSTMTSEEIADAITRTLLITGPNRTKGPPGRSGGPCRGSCNPRSSCNAL